MEERKILSVEEIQAQMGETDRRDVVVAPYVAPIDDLKQLFPPKNHTPWPWWS